MSSKKRKYREKISESAGSVLDLFDHPDFRSSTRAAEPVAVGVEDDGADDGADADEDADAPAAEPTGR